MNPWGSKIAQSSYSVADGVADGSFRYGTYGMAATVLPFASEPETELLDWASVFTYRATRDEIVVLELFGLQDPETTQIRVLAHVRNIRATVERPPQRTLHSFPDLGSATRFADEAIICFEYLGCIITTEIDADAALEARQASLPA